MSTKVFLLGSGAVLLVAAGLYERQVSRSIPPNLAPLVPGMYEQQTTQSFSTNPSPARAGSSWRPPTCSYGFEPGGGPIRCADPKDPNSYLYKKAKREAQRAADERAAASAASRAASSHGPYSIENPPKDDPKWCYAHAKGATELDRCWRRQHGEPMPEDFRPAPAAGGSQYSNWWARPSTRTIPANGACPGGKILHDNMCY